MNQYFANDLGNNPMKIISRELLVVGYHVNSVVTIKNCLVVMTSYSGNVVLGDFTLL